MRPKKTFLSYLGIWFLIVAACGCGSQQQRLFSSIEGETHSAVTPANRDGDRHRSFNQRIGQGNVDLIFVGDSITQGWEGAGRDVWSKFYGRRNAVNLGISGDRTQHVLWRLENGNIDGISPKVAVVMIGTNNLPKDRNTVEQTTDGVIAVCKKLRAELPDTRILLLGIFPRGQSPDDEMRKRVAATNKIISKLGDGKTIYYMDIGKRFLEPDGTISREIMPDYLHLTPRGYEIWAEAIESKLAELMQD